MAIAHRASAAANATNNTTSLTVTIPATVQTNDLLFLVTSNRGATTDPTVADDDSGGNTWARIGGENNTGSGDVWWKRATSGSASKTITVSNCTNSCSAVMSAFSGGKTTDPPYENVTAEANAQGDEVNAGFTPSVNGCMICLAVCGMADDAVSTQACTDPGALAEFAQHLNTAGNTCATNIAGAVQATAAITGNLTWAQSNRITVSVGWNILPDTGGILGVADITEANDTLAATGTLPIVGILSATEQNDTLVSTGVLPIAGTLSITEADDTLAATGTLALKGTASITEGDDTLLATGTLLVKGTLTVTEGDDTVASTGTLLIAGVLSITEGDDTLVATGVLPLSGLLNVTEENDTLAATGTLAIVGVLNITEDDDTLTSDAHFINKGGGLRPYYDVVALGWGAVRAYPQVLFDFVLETPPRGLPEPVAIPVIAPMPISDKVKLARYAEAAAAFDLELVRKYLEAVGIDLDA